MANLDQCVAITLQHKTLHKQKRALNDPLIHLFQIEEALFGVTSIIVKHKQRKIMDLEKQN